MTIEELTKEELIELIRKLNPELCEEDIVYDIFMNRMDVAIERRSEADKRGWEANQNICALLQPYADGPIKPGVKLRRFPKTVREEYEKLDRERREAWREKDAWWQQYLGTSRKLLELQTKRLLRWKG